MRIVFAAVVVANAASALEVEEMWTDECECWYAFSSYDMGMDSGWTEERSDPNYTSV